MPWLSRRRRLATLLLRRNVIRHAFQLRIGWLSIMSLLSWTRCHRVSALPPPSALPPSLTLRPDFIKNGGHLTRRTARPDRDRRTMTDAWDPTSSRVPLLPIRQASAHIERSGVSFPSGRSLPRRRRSAKGTAADDGIQHHTLDQAQHMATCDAMIIGTGQAGTALARRIAGQGMKAAIVERGRFGGTCVTTGCTPTKPLVASAYAAHLAQRRLWVQRSQRQDRYEAHQSA